MLQYQTFTSYKSAPERIKKQLDNFAIVEGFNI